MDWWELLRQFIEKRGVDSLVVFLFFTALILGYVLLRILKEWRADRNELISQLNEVQKSLNYEKDERRKEIVLLTNEFLGVMTLTRALLEEVKEIMQRCKFVQGDRQ